MTDQELKTLARDWCEDRVLFSTEVPENILQMVFMPLFFMNEETRQKMIADQVFALYGKMEDAGPRGINGYPIFTTMHSIQKDDYQKVMEYIKKYVEMQKAFAAGENG